ncbi:unnamed protein product [Rangifer tarandus platyrhynchus]
MQPLDSKLACEPGSGISGPRRRHPRSAGVQGSESLAENQAKVPSAPKAMARAKGEGWMLSISPIQVKRGPLEPRQEPAPRSQLTAQCHPAPETPR